MSFDEIIKYMNSDYSDKFSIEGGKEVIFVDAKNWLEIASILKNDKVLNFNYLMCLSSYDNQVENLYGVAYNFYSIHKNHYLEVRVDVKDGDSIPSVVSLWKTADWHEREAYDMMGIIFEGHPNLKRILLSDDWEGYPLRKDYKEPNYYHGVPVPKDKSYWE